MDLTTLITACTLTVDPKIIDQTFAGEAASLLVMVKPLAQLGRGQRRVGQGLHQSLSVPAFGARQRGHPTTRLAAQLDNSRPSITATRIASGFTKTLC